MQEIRGESRKSGDRKVDPQAQLEGGRFIEWLIRRLINAGARSSDPAKRRPVHAASAFPLPRRCRAVFGYG